MTIEVATASEVPTTTALPNSTGMTGSAPAHPPSGKSYDPYAGAALPQGFEQAGLPMEAKDFKRISLRDLDSASLTQAISAFANRHPGLRGEATLLVVAGPSGRAVSIRVIQTSLTIQQASDLCITLVQLLKLRVGLPSGTQIILSAVHIGK